jgi:hypothetical protein
LKDDQSSINTIIQANQDKLAVNNETIPLFQCDLSNDLTWWEILITILGSSVVVGGIARVWTDENFNF